MSERPIFNLRSPMYRWALPVALLLLTWGLRLCCLESVPPGWRDDELINIHALSGQVLNGRCPAYFPGANGHEPLYHYLHAGVHAVLGFNVLSGHLLSVILGALTVALTYVLARRLFGRAAAAIASLALSASFWSLMYSRTAIRHINLPPLALLALYLLWRSLTDKAPTSNPQPPTSNLQPPTPISRFIPLGLVVGLSLYTYPAARLLPVLLVLFAAYLALFHRDRFRRHWRGLLLALAAVALMALPLGVVVAQVAGADARIYQLAGPLHELRAGNPRPLLENVWLTLGMFHATGDPEWLYNVPDRPVFNLLGGLLLWAGVALCLCRWRRPRYFLLLLWLGLGLLPTFASVPPASLSHTILAQPVAYVLPALVLVEAGSWISSLSRSKIAPRGSPDPRSGSGSGDPDRAKLGLLRLRARISSPKSRRRLVFVVYCLAAVFLTTNAVRDLRDYFVAWPRRGMVRFLYRADYRETARYLDAHPQIGDVAVSSALLGPWDRLALEVDARRDDAAVRLFDPQRALIWVADGEPAAALLPSWPRPAPPIEGFLEAGAEPPEAISPHLTLYTLPAISDLQPPTSDPLARFANGLELVETRWVGGSPSPGQGATLLSSWRVAEPLDLPLAPIVANPPPPGDYSGPRLAVFVHLLAADGALVAGDDGLGVDPLTLRPGDRFIQAHRFGLPPDAPTGPYALALGLYDPMSGERWGVLDSSAQSDGDRVLILDIEERSR